MDRKNFIAALAALVVVIALVIFGTGRADGNPPGNNGTIKIHEQGTPDGTESNDPKVCTFNVEGFGFDAGQPFQIRGEVQGGDGPTGTNFTIPDVTADANGLFASEYVTPADGHYKVTAFGKDANGGYTLEKSKSKVIKVECDDETPPTDTPTTPETPETPTETPVTPVTPTPTTPTETPTVPTETPTVTPEPPVESEQPETPTPNEPESEQPENETPVSTPQPPKDVQVVECVNGVWVTSLNGEVISKSGSCEKRSTISSTPTVAVEEGL